jgi:cell division protein ZapA
MDEDLVINITIAERRYPMRIKRNEEEKIRKAAKMLNERILQYRKTYTGKDNQDFMAMSSLQFVIEMNDLKEQANIDPVIEELEQINQGLNMYLKNK